MSAPDSIYVLLIIASYLLFVAGLSWFDEEHLERKSRLR
jgi:hypothetical protein